MIAPSLRRLVIAASLALPFLLHPAKAATVLINDNFESYALNAIPGTPGDGNPNPWVFSGMDTSNVISGASTGGSAPNEKVLSLVNANGGAASISRKFVRQDHEALPGSTLQVSFKLKIDSLTDSNWYIRFRDETLDSNPLSIRIAANGSVLVLARAGGVPGQGGATNITNPQGAALGTSAWYQFDLLFDLHAQKYNLTITNLTTNVGGSTGLTALYYDVHSLDTLRFEPVNPASQTALGWRLDDVSISANVVPEAGTVALLVLGGVTLLVSRRHRRS